VVPFGQRLSGVARGKHSSYGQPPGHGLGQGHDIGHNPKVVLSEPLSCATEAGLHLIEDEQSIPVVAYLPSCAQELRIGHIDPRLSLHGLEDDRTRI